MLASAVALAQTIHTYDGGYKELFVAVSPDRAGDIVAVGWKLGGKLFGLVVKLDLHGNAIWSKKMGGIYFPTAVYVDSENNIYIGSISGALVKLSPSGELGWARALPQPCWQVFEWNGYIYALGDYEVYQFDKGGNLVNTWYFVGVNYQLVSSIVAGDRLYLLGWYDVPSVIAVDSNFRVVAAKTIADPALNPWFITTDGSRLYIGLLNASDRSMVVLAVDQQLNLQWALKWERRGIFPLLILSTTPERAVGVTPPGDGSFTGKIANAVYYNGRIYVPLYVEREGGLDGLLVMFDTSSRRVVGYYNISNAVLLSASVYHGRGGGWVSAVGSSLGDVGKQFVENPPPVKRVSLVLEDFSPDVHPEEGETAPPLSVDLVDYPLNSASVDPPPDALLFLIYLPPVIGGVVEVGVHFALVALGLALLVAFGVINARSRK